MDHSGKIISDITWECDNDHNFVEFLEYCVKYVMLSHRYSCSNNKEWHRTFNFANGDKHDHNASTFIGDWEWKDISKDGYLKISSNISLIVPNDISFMLFKQDVENCSFYLQDEYYLDSYHCCIPSSTFCLRLKANVDGQKYSIWWVGESTSTFSR